ncbi:MAG: aldehyde dehydrogenase [Alphaproteobacteria bacterium]|nr:MAG: aldehyde dehydrogenase [Alphaproteobacteria bacterium]
MGKIARRAFLIGVAAIAGGAAFGYYYVRKPYPNPLEDDLAEGEVTFNPYLKITADDAITVIAPRAEMGQGIHTTLAALVAEELDVALDRVTVEHGPGDWAYYNAAMMEDGGPFPFFDESFMAETMRSAMPAVAKVLGMQATGGSSSIRDGYVRMREAGCAARMMLVAAAARRWGVPATELQTRDGAVVDPAAGRTARYGELAAEAAAQEPPSKLELRDKADWKLLGKPQKRIDLLGKVTGSAQFGIDVELPDMLYGTVKMSPRFGVGARSASTDAAMAVPGVIKVVPIATDSGSGFGIVAENTWAAFRGAEALEVEWEEAPYPTDSDGQFAALAAALDRPADFALRDDGDTELAFADAPRAEVIEAEYRVPWLAHACMEPMNATARWKDGILDVWAPNQSPTVIMMRAAPLVGVKSDEVKVHTTYLGGGFGRRAELDFTLCAVLLAKEAQGRPVKVTWTREEDMRHDAYRPAAICRARARFVPGSVPSAVDLQVAAPSVVKSFLRRTFPSISPMGPDKTLTEGAHDQPYRIANYRVGGHVSDLPIPVGFWRSVGNSYNAFFHECFIDEIAHAAGVDPLAMRLRMMADYPAATGALKRVAEMAGWGYALPPGRGMGIAHTLSFGAWVAEIVQVRDTGEGMRIEKVWCAVDIGEALDADIVRAQMMSGIVFGLSSATGQQITFADGEVEQANFTDFDAMRMNQCPQIEVAVLETYHRMGGAGEPGTPPAIPALANAVFAATGKRVRSLPISQEIAFV